MSRLLDAARRAAQGVRDLPRGSRVRIVAHYDPDGVASAAVVVGALRRLGHNFHVTYTYEHAASYFESLAKEPYEANVFVDIGANVAPTIARLAGLNIVLDHHQAPPPPDAAHLVVVNAHHLGLNGMSEACGATTAFAFAVALDEANWAYAPHALVGVWGDRQARPAPVGWNAKVLEEGLRRGVLTTSTTLAVEDAPLGDLVARPPPHLEDAFRGVTEPEAFLALHGLSPKATVHELPHNEGETFSSLVVARLLAGGFPAYRVKELFHAVPSSPAHGLTIPRMTSLLSAATREQEAGLGLAFLLGDGAARRELEALESTFNEKLDQALRRAKAEVRALRRLQVFEVREPAYTGEVCGVAMARLLPRDRATVAYSFAGDVARISTRGTDALVASGLDLAKAVQEAARDVGGEGGGHAIASGATVERGRLDAFLAALDAIVVAQLGGPA